MSPLHRSITLALLFVCGVAVPANAQFGPFLTSSPNPSFEGEPVTFSTHGFYPSAITFAVDGIAHSTVSPLGGEAMFTTSSLTAGLHIVTASGFAVHQV